MSLPEMRWAIASGALFLLGWLLQVAGTPTALYWTAYLACYGTGGWRPALDGLRALRQRTLDVDLLMIVAAVAAAAIGQVFDGALLIVIFATSGALEALVTRRTGDSVGALLGLAPERATRLGPGSAETVVDCASLQPGDRILVRPGERIGADGTVIEGLSEVDQQAVTGESVPVLRRVGEDVLSGTLNGTGTLTVEVTHPASESVIARIVALVEEASRTKASSQLFIERVERHYSLIVVVSTLLALLLPMTLGDSDFDDALVRAIVFMIVASPCAVVLSTMPPLLASIATAGRNGVLVKSAAAMETVGRTDVVAFDKTGTLTTGTPEVIAVEPAAGQHEEDVLATAAAVERFSEHPLGVAIVAAAATRGLHPTAASGFQASPGRGVTGFVAGRRVSVQRADAASASIGTSVEVLLDGRRVGLIRLLDQVRPEAFEAVAELTAATSGRVRLLTGDNEAAAAAVAARTGIHTVHAALMPQDKARIVQQLQSGGRRVLLVGDGINDAPALVTASTGVAMGRFGSDLAVDSADAVIVGDDLRSLARLVRLSRRARRVVMANLCIAAVMIVTLVSWDLTGDLPLPLAVAGHEGSTILVALNGARLLRRSAWGD